MSSKPPFASRIALISFVVSLGSAAYSFGNCVVNGFSLCCDLVVTGGPHDHGPCPNPGGANCSDSPFTNPSVAAVQSSTSGFKDMVSNQSAMTCAWNVFTCEKVFSGYQCKFLTTSSASCIPTKISETNVCVKR